MDPPADCIWNKINVIGREHIEQNQLYRGGEAAQDYIGVMNAFLYRVAHAGLATVSCR